MTYYLSSPGFYRTQRMLRRMLASEFDQDDASLTFPMDVKAENESYIVTAALPGMDPEDIHIQVVNATVTIEGECKHDRDGGAQYLMAERYFGKFSRTITLPEPLDSSRATAEFNNGVLTLMVPKAEVAKTRSVRVINKSSQKMDDKQVESAEKLETA